MLQLIDHPNGIRELNLAHAPVNALGPELLRALREQIAVAVSDGTQGLILSGRPGLFTAGLDVPALLPLQRPALRQAMDDFFGIFAALAASPIPVVAAITGHSPAGGAVISIFCDYRIMATGDYRIGLNEVQVGLVAPECVQNALRRLVGPYRAERLLVAGSMITGAEAHACGMVDELRPVEGVVPAAVEWLQQLARLPRHAVLATRRIARAELVAPFAAGFDLDAFLDDWFNIETQTALHALVARLKK
ncbi:enoyl-CoA hydratase/isomerase family protein [Silvimonas sp.]|uniref:enoyl-CoA hydratase/isomerase family protein n=1 Tax=Silvimonas sp. TaxID=2650811 RepID=UPI00283D476D|nr:enoyl-CoA hydratase/isomerase family protein [Silvimonas sp.]MDR3429193.1 enoyl-CoA hydratase/isomerase family protein [Silvimonas sp.]